MLVKIRSYMRADVKRFELLTSKRGFYTQGKRFKPTQPYVLYLYFKLIIISIPFTVFLYIDVYIYIYIISKLYMKYSYSKQSNE